MKCSPHHIFWVRNGKTIDTLEGLVKELKKMDDETFKHHTKGKNDFANWVEHVWKKKKVAQEMRKAKTKETMAKKIQGKTKTRKRVIRMDETTRIMPEGAHTHVSVIAHLSLGVVIGSAITVLILLML